MSPKAAIRLKRNEKRTKQSAKRKNETQTHTERSKNQKRTYWKVDRAVTIGIDFVDHVLQLCLGRVLTERSHDGTCAFTILQRSVNAIQQKFFIVSEFDLAKNNFKISKGSFPSSYSRILPISLSLSISFWFDSNHEIRSKSASDLSLSLLKPVRKHI